MRKLLMVSIVSAVFSASAFAVEDAHVFDHAVATRDADVSAEANASANRQAALNAYNDTTSRDGSGRFNPDNSTNQAIVDKAQSAQDAEKVTRQALVTDIENVNGVNYRNQLEQQQLNAMLADTYGVKNNPQLTAQYSEQNTPVYSGTSMRPATDTINVAVSSLKPSTRVSVTVNGQTTLTTAAELAKINPSLQVAVPHVPALMTSLGSNAADKNGGKGHHGSEGRGADSAHSHAFGGHGYGADNSKSEGFGGHSHFH